MTSENILLGLHHTEDAFTGVHLGGQSSRLGFRTVSLSGCAKLSGDFVIKGPVHKGFCRLYLRCLLVLEKSHSSIARPVSQISGSVTGGVPHYCGRPETSLPPVQRRPLLSLNIFGSEFCGSWGLHHLRPHQGRLLRPW